MPVDQNSTLRVTALDWAPDSCRRANPGDAPAYNARAEAARRRADRGVCDTMRSASPCSVRQACMRFEHHDLELLRQNHPPWRRHGLFVILYRRHAATADIERVLPFRSNWKPAS